MAGQSAHVFMHNVFGPLQESADSDLQVGISKCQAHLASLKKSLKNPGMRMVGGACVGGRLLL